MKKILTYIWSAWCLFWFFWILIFTTIFLNIGLGIFGKKSHPVMIWVPYYFSKILMFLWGIKFKCEGLEKFDNSQKHIYVFNHSSNIDHYLSTFVAPLGRYIAKAELLKVPGFGIILKHLHIPVRRNDKNDRKRSLKDAIKAIEDGKSPTIYPEGTRNNTSDLLLPFKNGPFVMAKATNTPVIACTFLNISDVIYKSSYLITPGTVYGICDAPFYPENYETVEEFKEAVRNSMLANLESYIADNQ